MTNEQEMVLEFMKTFKQYAPPTPAMPDYATRELRAKLILEESLETIAALGITVTPKGGELKKDEYTFSQGGEPDMVEIVDGLADLHYVGYCGTANACGIDMEAAFKEVHRSNMSKLWTADEIKSDFFNDGLVAIQISAGTSPVFLVKRADGKAVKSPSYSEANLLGIIEWQNNRPSTNQEL